MLKIYVVRHGETDWNVEGRVQGWTDTPLNAKGLAQARLIAARLGQEKGFAAIYSSPLQRAWRTAEDIAGTVGLSPVAEPRLKERCLGMIEGHTFLEIEQQHPELYRRWRQDPRRVALPGEEARETFQDRIRGLLEELQARHPDGRIILVTHGGTLAMIVATVIQLDVERHFPFWFDNACLNVVEFGGRVPRVLSLNDTCHLRNGSRQPNVEQELALDAKTAGSSPEPGVLEA
ncbi:MAG: histidine phosphatase family protein [Rudaea sp.]